MLKKHPRTAKTKIAKRVDTSSKASDKQVPSRKRKNIGALFEDLVAVQEQLRAPNGCPWDREQTHESLRTYLLEETYEALDALDSGNFQEFAGELGDILLQVLFHADLAREAGHFDLSDVVKGIHDKMVRRHPHVFGDVKADTSAQVLKNWEQLKAAERAANTKGRGAGSDSKKSPEEKSVESSVLDAVPRSLPGLLEAHQMTRRASNVGFDWKDIDGIFEKLTEETAELRQALRTEDRSRQEEEMGDLLFVCVNLARFLGFDPEIALKKTNRKFSHRFRHMERSAQSRGQELGKLSKVELEALWKEAKQHEAIAKF